MNRYRWLARSWAIHLALLTGVSHADMTWTTDPSPEAMLSAVVAESQPTVADPFATGQLTATLSAASSRLELPAEGTFFGGSVLPLAGSAVRSFALAVTPPAASQPLSLWHFITTVRALQADRSFALLDNNLRILELSSSSATGAVPLRGSAWFLVIGLLGFAGVQLTQRQERASTRSGGAGLATPIAAV
jgi:hypothetical protein